LSIPSTLRGSIPSPPPADLPPELLPPAQPIAFHTPVDATDQLHAFVNEEMLGLSVSAMGELQEMAAMLGFEPIVELISILAARLVGAGERVEEQLALAEMVFEGAPVLDRIRSALRDNPGAHVFAEQNLYALMQLLIDHGRRSAAGEKVRPEEQPIFNRFLLAAGSIVDLERDELASEFADGESWLPFLIQLSAIYSHPQIMEEVTRVELMLDIARSPGAKEFENYCPIDHWYEDELGLSAEEQMRLMMAFAARLDIFDGSKTKTRIAADAVDGLLRTAGLEDRREEALALISSSREKFRDDFAARGQGIRRLLWEMRPFKATPFLRCQNGDLILLSPRFVESWFSEGFHHRALNIARKKGAATRYAAFAGRLYESYCVELTRDAHEGSLGVRVHGDRPYIHGKGGKTCDVAVDYVTDLILVEATNSRFRASTLTKGDRAEAHEDLERVLICKCRQLTNCIDRILAGDAPFPDDLGQLRNIWPIVVSAGVPMQTPALWNFLYKKLPNAFGQPRVRPLTLLDPEEYEVLCGLVEGGTPLPVLLARKTAEAYRHLDLKAWLADDPEAPRYRARASMIERAFEASTRRIADGMTFAGPQEQAA
jgi:hypothetical protein